MKNFNKYENVIAIIERTAGNETVGSMWLETKSFHKNTPISEIIEWSKSCDGKLIITIDENNAEGSFYF